MLLDPAYITFPEINEKQMKNIHKTLNGNRQVAQCMVSVKVNIIQL